MRNQLQCVARSLSVGSLASYISWVNQIPMLSVEEEHDLAIKLIKNNDLDAARRLVLAHLRFVVRIARGYDGYGLQQADLIQEGNIGLMKAVRRFDHKVGVRLVSFAVHWVRAEIHEFILKNWRIVKIATTKAQRKLFFNLRKATKKGGWFSDQEVAVVAEELKVSHKDVRQMESRLNSYDQSFDSHEMDDEEDSWGAPAQYLEDHRYNPALTLESDDWQDNRHEQLYQALHQLDERSQDIIKERWLKNTKKATLHDLAVKYRVSAERIRQLEKNAFAKMQQLLASPEAVVA